MPRALSKLLIAIAAMLGIVPMYALVFTFADRTLRFDDTVGLALATVVSVLCFIPAWIALWWREVEWTARRARLTLLLSAVAFVPAAMVGGSFMVVSRFEDEVAVVFGGMSYLLLWIAGTAWLWRETPLERTQRLDTSKVAALPCPSCGYDLTGLHDARCPECGTQFTLDQLVNALRAGDWDFDRHG
jgi:hypothetical protein